MGLKLADLEERLSTLSLLLVNARRFRAGSTARPERRHLKYLSCIRNSGRLLKDSFQSMFPG